MRLNDEVSVADDWSAFDVCSTEEERAAALEVDLAEAGFEFAELADYYRLVSFPIFGVGFTAPKGHIRLTMNMHGAHLMEIAQIVKHSGENLVCMIFAPKKPFPDE